MSTDTKSPQKVCKVCQSDVAQLPRVKDAHGRYYCKPCYDTASQSKSLTAPTRAPAVPVKATAPKKPIPQAEIPKPSPPPAPLDDFMDGFDPSTAEVVEAPTPGIVARVGRCPACNVPLAPDAVICIACGTNAKSGKKLKGAAVAGAAGGIATQAAKALGNYAQGVLFGALGAAIGAALWCGVAVATGYEIGYIAWALGGLAGFGMQLGYGDANPKAGLTAVGLALIGIAASKISIVYFLLKGKIAVSALISVEVLKATMEPIDLVFVGLAALTAYRLGTHGISFNE